MSVLEFIQLILRNKKWVLYFPLVVGIGVFLLTRNTPHTYTTNMVIYTGIASGFNPDNEFDGKIDFHAVNSRFDNLINIIGSGETRKDVGVSLLAFMINNPGAMSELLDHSKNEWLTKVLNKEFVKKYAKGDEAATAEFLDAQLTKGQGTEVYELVYGEKKNPFNVKTLTDIKAERVGFSDMLKIEYTCEDPFTCKKTLDITKDIFLAKYKAMRVGEANSAVKYFREQTAIAKSKLQLAENNLKAFRSANGVINYYEQTKYIADQKEDIDKSKSALEMEISGYKAALAKVESKLNARFLIQLESEKVVLIKNNLGTELNNKGIDAVKSGTNVNTQLESEKLKKALKESVDKLYSLNNSTEGIPGKNLLEEWLKLSLLIQESESKLQVLLGNQTQFEKVFDRYAPMGSELSKLEREVETAEKEYLNLLHNLNQAILRENNLELSENISVIDDAAMPFVPNPSKRLMLIIAAVLASVILSIVMLIIRQYLDRSIASPMRMEKITGFKTATAFIDTKLFPDANDAMNNRSYERWQMAIANVLQRDTAPKTILTLPFNVAADQAKPYIEGMSKWMDANGFNTPFYENIRIEEHVDETCFVFTDKVFVEQQVKGIAAKTAMVIMIFDAHGKLDEYQMASLEAWKKTGLVIKGILINTDEQHISKYLGDIPRKKSKLRIFIKKQFLRYAS